MNAPAASFEGFDIDQLDLQAQWLELERFECESSIMTFLERAWPHFDPAEFTSSWLLEAIADHLEAVTDTTAEGDGLTRLITNVPPRTGKTSLFSIAYPAWVWAQRERSPNSGPHVKFLYVSYNESLSREHSVACRRLVKSEWYQERWPHVRITDDVDNLSKFETTAGGSRAISSIGSRVTGKGADIIVVDDPNATNDLSENKLKEVTDYFDNTLRSRLNNKKTGAILIVQQRTAENDLTGHILEHYPSEYDHIMIPMLFEPDRSYESSIGWKDPRTYAGEPLWPERFNEKFINAEKKTKYTWCGQYQQRPEVAGGGIIKREWWQPWDRTAFPPMDLIVASLDTAFTTKKENDPSAMTVWGVFSTDDYATAGRTIDSEGRPIYWDRAYNETAPKVMLMYAWAEHLEFYDLIQKVEKTCKVCKVDRLIIENKAAGISLAQELRRTLGTAEFGIILEDPKAMDKVARLFSVQHLFEEGMIYAPDKVWADQVITQVGQFPKAKHDDLCFVAGTRIATESGDRAIEDIRVGDRVWTPFGLRPVSAAGFTGVRPVIQRSGLTGTACHPVFILDKGWVELDTVTQASKIGRLNLFSLIRTTHPKQLALMASSSAGWAESENTTFLSHEQTKGEGAPKGCMSRSGSTLTGLCQKGMKSTTKTVTRSIVALKVWSRYQLASIAGCRKISTWISSVRISIASATSRLLGINRKKGGPGTGKLRRNPWTKPEPHEFHSSTSRLAHAFGAEPRFRGNFLGKNTADLRVRQTTVGGAEDCAKKSTRILQPVFNLTVEGAHCYYANGILVHNCDTTSQALRHLRDIGVLTRTRERLDDIASHLTYPGSPSAPLYPA